MVLQIKGRSSSTTRGPVVIDPGAIYGHLIMQLGQSRAELANGTGGC